MKYILHNTVVILSKDAVVILLNLEILEEERMKLLKNKYEILDKNCINILNCKRELSRLFELREQINIILMVK